MMNGFIEARSSSELAFTFDNLPDGVYDLYVYLSANGFNVGIDISDGDFTATYYVTEDYSFVDGSVLTQATNTVANAVRDRGYYVKFASLNTVGSSKLSIYAGYAVTGDGDGCGVSGLQLVQKAGPTPNTVPSL